jgi:hypothetical protein
MTEAVRALVRTTFSELGIDSAPLWRETVLIRDGAYCGRRFDVAGGHAIWFVEEQQIKFYLADGRLACKRDLHSPRELPRKAAA